MTISRSGLPAGLSSPYRRSRSRAMPTVHRTRTRAPTPGNSRASMHIASSEAESATIRLMKRRRRSLTRSSKSILTEGEVSHAYQRARRRLQRPRPCGGSRTRRRPRIGGDTIVQWSRRAPGVRLRPWFVANATIGGWGERQMAATAREYDTRGGTHGAPLVDQLRVREDSDVVAAFLSGEE